MKGIESYGYAAVIQHPDTEEIVFIWFSKEPLTIDSTTKILSSIKGQSSVKGEIGGNFLVNVQDLAYVDTFLLEEWLQEHYSMEYTNIFGQE